MCFGILFYFEDVVSEKVLSLVFSWAVGSGYVDGLTFVCVQFHIPLIFP